MDELFEETLPKALRTQALTASTNLHILQIVHIFHFLHILHILHIRHIRHILHILHKHPSQQGQIHSIFNNVVSQ